MKKKGFTLIELLAVIVILAIIALIAVPVVLKIIEKAREGAAKDSALSYMKAVETYTVSSKLDKNAIQFKANEEYGCTTSTMIDGKNYLPLNDVVELNGFRPEGNNDYLKLDKGKNIDEGILTINGYIITISDGKIVSIVKGQKIEVEGMNINYTSQAMEKGSTFKLKAIFTPSNASDQRVTYTSSNENVVTVSSTGIVTAVGNGEAKVTVTSKAKSSLKKECNITVTTSATGVNVAPTTANIKVGRTVQLTGTIEPNDVTTNALTWESSDATIAHVDANGLVTGMGAGTATITVKTVNNKTAASTITVEETAIEAPNANDTHKGIVYLDPTDLTKKCGSSNSISATEVKSGCMKWYIFDDSGSNYKMILDHNTTAWNRWKYSYYYVAYADSDTKTIVENLVSQSEWKVTPRLLTPEEVNTITGNTTFAFTTSNYNNVGNPGIYYYFDTKTTTAGSYSNGAVSPYHWLYDRTYNCAQYGCEVPDNNTYGTASNNKRVAFGYWLQDTTNNINITWRISNEGSLISSVPEAFTAGVRPVIEVSKTQIK